MGAQFHCNWSFYTDADRRAVVAKLAAAGVTWVRIDVSWEGIEDASKGARNSWYIGMVDYCVDEARKAGLQVLVTLWLTPGWANGGRGTAAPPSNPQDYADFARWAAGHWRGRVSAWEVWNEPNPNQSFWGGTTEQYVRLLQAAYPAFKAGDQNALVVFGAPDSNEFRWIEECYKYGVKGSFDVMATHPYQGMADYPPEHPTDGNVWWLTSMPLVKQVMERYGDGAKPIWWTEFGWSAGPAPTSSTPNWKRQVSLTTQAEYARRALELASKSYPYVTHAFWYKERARPNGDAFYEGYGILNADLSERPVYTALKSLLNP